MKNLGVLPPGEIYPEISEGYLKKMATAGPMCRYAEDLLIFLQVIFAIKVCFQQINFFQGFGW